MNIVIEGDLLIEELKKFAVTCCLETALLNDIQRANKEYLRCLGETFAEVYVGHLIEMQADA